MKTSRPRKKRSRAYDIAFLVLLVLLIMGFGFIQAGEALLQEGTLLPGSTINGIDVGGKSVAQALEIVAQAVTADLAEFTIDVRIGGETLGFTAAQAGMMNNAQDIMASALRRVESGSIFARLGQLFVLREGIELEYDISYDADAVRASAHALAEITYTPPRDASVALNRETNGFEYTGEQAGWRIDEADLAKQLLERLDALSDAPLEIALRPMDAALSEADLRANFQHIATYTAHIVGDEAALRNIDHGIETLDGVAIGTEAPLSVNAIAGPYISEHGYILALVPYSGQSRVEMAGGIGQVASALYNAALLAGLDIAERYPHAISTAYAPIGQDACVTGDSMDLVLQNSGKYPAIVRCRRDAQMLRCDIYGVLPEGVDAITVASSIIQTVPAQAPRVIIDGMLRKGAEVRDEVERDGYLTETWRYYYQSGIRTREELVSEDYYPPVQAVYRQGK